MEMRSDAEWCLPEGAAEATLVGRVWRPDLRGPAVVVLRDGELLDVTDHLPTVSALCAEADPAGRARSLAGQSLGPLDAVLANTPRAGRDPGRPWLLSPVDLQSVKASGVTFVNSLLERVIEEQARGNPAQAEAARKEIQSAIGQDLASLKPGSEEAAALKRLLIEKGLWSQYLEVGIGPDVEVFTKAQPLSSVGHLAEVGILAASEWNNPEPEVVLVVAPDGRIVGATLGNDVNLRDMEGRSALLLGKAKDNNASAALGPFIRLFDETFSMRDVEQAEVRLRVEGADGFVLEGSSSMSEISRSPAELVAAAMGAHHQYPDGIALYLGTMFVPSKDRGEQGKGFTHHLGDTVAVSSPKLGRLVNRVQLSTECPPWRYGVSHLMRDLAKADLI